MQSYAAAWSQLVLFLLRIQQHTSDTLAEYLLYPDDSMQACVDEVTEAIETLMMANTDDVSVEDCIRISDDQTQGLRLHAKALVHAVDILSVQLVKQTRLQDPFSIAVVVYSSLNTFNRYGAWKAATDFRPFLSAMIHCMQLWLLGHCMQHCQDASAGPNLQDYAVEQCRQHLVNTSSGAIAELSYWRLLCKASKNDTPRPPVTTVTDDCMQVNHANLELRLPAWRQFLRDIFYEAAGILDHDLLFDISSLKAFPASSLRDDLNHPQPGWSFLQDTRNGLHVAREDIVDQLLRSDELQRRFFKDRSQANPDNLVCNRPAVSGYLHADQRFLQLLAILFIMTAGLPFRRKELLGICWCNQEAPRNIYIYDGQLAVFTSYNKSQWRVGARPVARFLPPTVGDIVVRYLTYVLPVIHLFSHCMQLPLPRGFLFRGEQGIWSPEQLSATMKLYTRRLLGTSIRIRQWRHIAIALDRRLLQGVACQVYNIDPNAQAVNHEDDSDSDRDEWNQYSQARPYTSLTASNVHSLQAAHTLDTGVTHYGNSLYPFAFMTDVLLADFAQVSRQWHQMCQMPSPELVACSHKRAVSASAEQPSQTKRLLAGGRLHIRRQLWTWPILQQGLQKLFGSNATIRDSMQRDALRLFASSHQEIIIIMPTGSGKSVLFMVMSVIFAAEVTIVIMPLVALRQDLIRRCTELGVSYWHYSTGDRMQDRLHTVPSLVLVDVEIAVTPSFNAFAKQLSDLGRLDRLVIDEAHLILTASDYREHLGLLAILRQIPCPLICLTATLPPIGELDLKESLFLSYPTIHRVSSDRRNLEYCVQSTTGFLQALGIKDPLDQDDVLAAAAETVYLEDLRRWQRIGTQTSARSLYFVRSKKIGGLLAERLHCDFYHAGLNSTDRVSLVTAWSQGTSSSCLVTTTALGAGLDYPSIRRVVHIDAPSGLVAYGQETGRAGRDGLHAICLTILPPKWSVDWDRRYRSDFLQEDCVQAEEFLRSRHCLRQKLTFYLDGFLGGRYGIACSDTDGIERATCGNCSRPQRRLGMSQAHPIHRSEQQGLGLSQAHRMQRLEDKSKDPSPTTSDSDDEMSSENKVSTTLNTETIEVMSTPCSPVEAAVGATTHHIDAWDMATHMSRLATMKDAEAQALYEQRLAAWGRACILCSFRSRQRTSFPHADCMQGQYSESLGKFRRSINFENGIGCFGCGQPLAICKRKGKGGCQYPWFVWHCCWVAVHEDRLHGVELVQALGGPDLSSHAVPDRHPLYLRWLGKGSKVFGSVKGSNALRMACIWVDRIECLCIAAS